MCKVIRYRMWSVREEVDGKVEGWKGRREEEKQEREEGNEGG